MNKSTFKKEENGKIFQSSIGQSYKTQILISKKKSYFCKTYIEVLLSYIEVLQ